MKHHCLGYTIVEVIVVGTIVAILALSMIQIYAGYVDSSRQQVVQNSAAAAATYLIAAINLGVDVATDLDQELEGDDVWSTHTSGDGTPSTFRAPAGVVIIIDSDAGTVSATLEKHSSSPVQFR